jgi:hypothetical protein
MDSPHVWYGYVKRITLYSPDQTNVSLDKWKAEDPEVNIHKCMLLHVLKSEEFAHSISRNPLLYRIKFSKMVYILVDFKVTNFIPIVKPFLTN